MFIGARLWLGVERRDNFEVIDVLSVEEYAVGGGFARSASECLFLDLG